MIPGSRDMNHWFSPLLAIVFLSFLHAASLLLFPFLLLIPASSVILVSVFPSLRGMGSREGW